MRSLTLIVAAILLCATPCFAEGAVGSEVPTLKSYADSSAKAGLYLVALAALGYFVKKRQRSTNQSKFDQINILTRRSVTAKHALVIAEVEGRRLLLGLSGDNMQLLTELERVEFSSELSKALEIERIPTERLKASGE